MQRIEISAAARRAGHAGPRSRRRGALGPRSAPGAGRKATRSRPCWAVVLHLSPSSTPATLCRCPPVSISSRPPPCRRRCSRCSLTSSNLARLKAGEALMVHGATSGIGVAAIQMGKAARLPRSSPPAAARARRPRPRRSARTSWSTPQEDFAEAAQAQPAASDVILDMVGGDYAVRGIDALNPGGRLVMISTQAGFRVEINLLKVMQKQLVIAGSTLRPARGRRRGAPGRRRRTGRPGRGSRRARSARP